MRISLQQIQTILEISRHNFHISKAAEHMNTSQSVLSKHLKSLENSLSVPVFTRSGKRLNGLTPEGMKILSYAEKIFEDYRSIEKIAGEAHLAERESLNLATTPTLARYLLADTVKAFTQAHPQVQLHIRVEESDKVTDAVRHGLSDLGIVPIGNKIAAGLEVSPIVQWSRLLIGTPECPLFDATPLTLEMIASEPIIAFETLAVSMRETFDRHNIQPNVALTTSNPEVMKAYAALGLGVAIVAAPTYNAQRDAPLKSRDVSHLFPDVQIAVVNKPARYRTTMQTRFLEYLQRNLIKQ